MLELRYLDKQDGTRLLQQKGIRINSDNLREEFDWEDVPVVTEETLPYDFIIKGKEGYIQAILSGLGGKTIAYGWSKANAKCFPSETEARIAMEKNNMSLWDYEVEKREG